MKSISEQYAGRRKKRVQLFIILLVTWAIQTAEAAKKQILNPETEIVSQNKTVLFTPIETGKKWEMILTIWKNKRREFTEGIKKNLDNRNLGNSLYNFQTQTNNLLKAAAVSKRHKILDELATLYLVPYNYLELI